MSASQNLRLVTSEPSSEGPLTFEQVYRLNAPYVAGVATRLLGREADVDDVMQTVFAMVIKDLEKLRDRRSIKPWLATITVRVARAKLRVRRLRTWVGLDDADAYQELTVPGTTGPDRVLLSRIYRVLDGLPVDDRIAWTLRYVEGEQLEEVARACKCSLATAKRRIAAAQDVIEKVVLDE
jgi:RNA polymerase sigma-70 factor (ECF subfamily)